jgi:hypothetical protein
MVKLDGSSIMTYMGRNSIGNVREPVTENEVAIAEMRELRGPESVRMH